MIIVPAQPFQSNRILICCSDFPDLTSPAFFLELMDLMGLSCMLFLGFSTYYDRLLKLPFFVLRDVSAL